MSKTDEEMYNVQEGQRSTAHKYTPVHCNIFWDATGERIIAIPRDPKNGLYGCYVIYLERFEYGVSLPPICNINVATGEQIFPKP